MCWQIVIFYGNIAFGISGSKSPYRYSPSDLKKSEKLMGTRAWPQWLFLYQVVGIRLPWVKKPVSGVAVYCYYCYYFFFNFYFFKNIFKPGHKSWDFRNYKKSVRLERPLIRVINNQKSVVQQNWIKALHHHRQTLEQKKNFSRSSPGSVTMRLPRSPTSS